jgi:crotonobetainyl-CoA:carnitine CoA-transferase CaiB-like acyl-CoA transferase
MIAALDDLNVLDLGEFISAPYCAKMLADLGAEVLKVEPPHGDRSRRYGPFRGDVPNAEASGLFLYLNANKRGVTLDLTTPTGVEILRELVAKADVVVENLDPEQVRALDLTPERLRTFNPAAVVTSISTFGRTGPRAAYRGHSLQAAAGSAVAQRTGDPARSPLSKPLNETEFIGGVHAAAATLLALLFRDRGGGGQHVDIAIQDVLASVTSGIAVAAATYGTRRLPGRSGHRVNAFFPWTVLPVADGFMEFITMQDRQWDAFVEEIGSPEWAADPRFQNKLTMPEYAEELEAHIVEAVGQRTRADLWEACRRRGISFQPVHRIDEIVESPQLREREYFADVPDDQGRPVTVPGAPYKLSGSPWALRRPAPRLGEHNCEVYVQELGMEPAQLVDLIRAGVL